MNCQKCGHEVNEHGEGGCNHGWGPDDDAPYQCFCAISQIDALRLAQRAAAFSHLRELGKLAREGADRYGRIAFDDMTVIWAAADAYRAVGILERKL